MKYIGNGRCEHMLTLNASPDILNVSSHEIYSTRFTWILRVNVIQYKPVWN